MYSCTITDMPFEVVNIQSERSMDGFTTITFRTANSSVIEGCMTIKMHNKRIANRDTIRKCMVEEFVKQTKLLEEKGLPVIKVGDII